MAAEPRYLLDSNIAIYLLGGLSLAAANRLAACEVGSVITSSICLAQIMVRLTPAQSERLPLFLDHIAAAPFDTAAAQTYAGLPSKRHSFDRLIAAHALSLGLVLITANTADFYDIAGLRVEDWMLA